MPYIYNGCVCVAIYALQLWTSESKKQSVRTSFEINMVITHFD